MATNAKIDWRGEKPHIIYGPLRNLNKIVIQFVGFSLAKTLSYSLEDEIFSPQRQKRFKKKIKFANLVAK